MLPLTITIDEDPAQAELLLESLKGATVANFGAVAETSSAIHQRYPWQARRHGGCPTLPPRNCIQLYTCFHNFMRS